MPFKTLSTLDHLENVQDSVAAFNEQTLADRVAEALAVHNGALQEAVEDFAILTNQYQLPYGVADDFEIQVLDQFGSPDVSATSAAGTIGLPLRFHGGAVQWTRHFLLNTAVGRLLSIIDSAAAKDRQYVVRQIRQRLLTPTNTTGYNDALQTRNTYTVHALLNGDGMAIPNGPNGETFNGASHTHFNAEASLSEAGLQVLIDDVVEHGVDGTVVIYINRAQEAAIRAMTTSFTAYVDARITPGSGITTADGDLNPFSPTDRAIGLFNGAEVWVKPWVPANYQIAFDQGAGNDKPLAIRTRSGAMAGDAYQGGFGQLYEDEVHPLRARALGREFGVGVNQRHKAAVNYSGGASYVAPAL
jgi:hypothetical protein